jgi:hypothetical protein
VNLEERERYNQLLQLTDPASSHKHQHHQRNGRKLSTEERILRVSPMKRDYTVNDKHTHIVQRMDNALQQLKDLTHDDDGVFIVLYSHLFVNIIIIIAGTITLDDDNNQTTSTNNTHRHTSSDSVVILRDTLSPSTSTTSSTTSSWVDARERTHELTQRFACFDPKEILENM